MNIKIEPSHLYGTITPPSSKSMGHRALICAALAQGESEIFGLDDSKDIEATRACLERLGAHFHERTHSLIVEGCDPSLLDHAVCLPCNESGSTLRFLVPIAALSRQTITMKGKGRLMARPMKIYEDLFKEQHLSYTQSDSSIVFKGPIHAQEFIIPGNISSQFISGLLFALPLLKEDSKIVIQPPYESKSYVSLTLSALAHSGIKIEEKDDTYTIKGDQHYEAKRFIVEKDFSQMAFFAVLAALRYKLSIKGMDRSSAQGDKAICAILERAGAKIEADQDVIEIAPSSLKGQTIDLSDCPDLGPILCVLGAFSEGETKIIHAKRLRMKESDRIAAMEEELRKWGVAIESDEDTITIKGKKRYDPTAPVTIDGHNDHRIVMACTIFALCLDSPTYITGAEAITKSYPTFFEDITKLHGKVELV